MPGYSKIVNSQTKQPFYAIGNNPDGLLVMTSLAQCDDCGAVITTVFTDAHDRDHESRVPPVVISAELQEQIQHNREHPEEMVARPKRGAAKSDG